MLTKLTPILFVERIEAQLSFWVDTLGFSQTITVPENPATELSEDNPLGFVTLQRDGIEVMLQTWVSISADIGWQERQAQSFLFIEVDDLTEIETRIEGLEKAVPRRETFYGASEVGVRDPAGNLIVFAQFRAEMQNEAV